MSKSYASSTPGLGCRKTSLTLTNIGLPSRNRISSNWRTVMGSHYTTNKRSCPTKWWWLIEISRLFVLCIWMFHQHVHARQILRLVCMPVWIVFPRNNLESRNYHSSSTARWKNLPIRHARRAHSLWPLNTQWHWLIKHQIITLGSLSYHLRIAGT